MDFSKYMDGAAQTMPEDIGRRDLLADAALGLCGEAEEILEVVESDGPADPAELDDEVGDGWWYVAAAYHALEMRPADVVAERDVERLDLYRAGCRVAECAKKIRYHHDSFEAHRETVVDGLRVYAAVLASLGEGEVAEIWRANVEKLAQRHPDGFDPGS